MPNILNPEQYMGESLRQWQRELEQHALARLHSSHPSLVQQLLVSLGTCFVVLGTRMIRLAQRDRHSL